MAINYDELAPTYDRHRRGGGPYFDTLCRLAREADARDTLEVAAGTGNETEAFLAAHPSRMVVAEPSAGMLRQLRAKRLPTPAVRADGLHLPFPVARFDFLFAAYALHYIEDLTAFFRECRRVLRGGCAAFVTVPEGFIANHPMNAFFPSFAAVDLARFPRIEAVVEAMTRAGFDRVSTQTDIDQAKPVDERYVQRIESRFISTYELLPPGELADGLERLRTRVAQPGGSGITIAREATTVWGWQD